MILGGRDGARICGALGKMCGLPNTIGTQKNDVLFALLES